MFPREGMLPPGERARFPGWGSPGGTLLPGGMLP